MSNPNLAHLGIRDPFTVTVFISLTHLSRRVKRLGSVMHVAKSDEERVQAADSCRCGTFDDKSVAERNVEWTFSISHVIVFLAA